MKKVIVRTVAALILAVFALTLFTGTVCFADTETAEAQSAETEETAQDSGTTAKAVAAAACVALVAAIGAISMGFAISKSTDGISRQPEADGKIRTTLMLGLVFIETVVIYALIVAILIIFVL